MDRSPLSVEFSRQEDWSVEPFPPLGDLPRGLNPHLLRCRPVFLTTVPLGIIRMTFYLIELIFPNIIGNIDCMYTYIFILISVLSQPSAK